jgi:hypothetical protein
MCGFMCCICVLAVLVCYSIGGKSKVTKISFRFHANERQTDEQGSARTFTLVIMMPHGQCGSQRLHKTVLACYLSSCEAELAVHSANGQHHFSKAAITGDVTVTLFRSYERTSSVQMLSGADTGDRAT